MRTLIRWVGGMLAVLLMQLAALGLAQAQTGSDFDHNATGFVLNAQHQNVRCETCHIKGQFKGTPTTCEACHGWNNPRAATVMPTNHIPTRNAPCESCHAPNMSQFQDALRVFSHVSVPAMSCLNCHDSRNPHPGVRTNPSDAVHAQVLSSNTACGSCHTTLQFEGPKPPSNHIPVAAVPCSNCHLGADFRAMPSITAIHANAPSSSSNCVQCHSSAAAAAFAMPGMVPAIVAPPANHIPMNGQSCEVCHVGASSSLSLPVVDGSRFANARFSHSGISGGCATCHGPAVNPAGFAGIGNIVRMPDSSSPGPLSHIPSSTACETCHAGSMPAGQVSATATATVPGTGFQNPRPSRDMVHAGVGSNCASCHDTNAVWLGMQLYPLSGYTGFQTRPQVVAGTFNVADQFHPTTGDCSQCHTGISFDPSLVKKPANHIPTSANCSNCHKDPGGDYSVMPTLADTHANAQAGLACADCHSSANAARYTMSPALVAPPADHISMGTLGCESCHIGTGSSLPAGTVLSTVPNGASFANSAFSHSGLTLSCASCHGAGAASFRGVTPKNIASLSPPHLPVLASAACDSCHTNSTPTTLVPSTGATGSMKTFADASFLHSSTGASCATCHGQNVGANSFAGNPAIIVMPASTTASASSHIPTSAACDACHKSTPTGVIPANATSSIGSTGFRLPAPTTADIHANTSSTCASCHERDMDWLGVGVYPRTTAITGLASTRYTGFQTRPYTGGANYSLNNAHPTSGDCATCHSVAAGFTAAPLPVTHIPTSASCGSCHTAASFAVMPAVADIHANAQPGLACADCHSSANAAKYPMSPALVAPPANHIAMGTLGCEGCHVGSNSSMPAGPVANGASFANSAFSHNGLTTACASCHGASAASFYGVVPLKISSLAPAHMPVLASVGCETCHTNNTPATLIALTGASGGDTTFAGAKFTHSGSNASCATCHGPSVGTGSFAGSPVITTMPQSAVPGPAAHIPSNAACDSCHKTAPSGLLNGSGSNTGLTSSFVSPLPTTTDIHANGAGSCSGCHESGMSWVGVALYPRTAQTSYVAGVTYTGFQTRPTLAGSTYSVSDATPHPATGECSNCHASTSGFGAPTKPSTHIPTSAGCAACHKSADYAVMPGLTDIHANAQSGTTCAQCHSTANAAKYPMTPALVAPPANHVPMGALGCEACHVGNGSSMASTTVVDGASFAGSLFSHSGISSGCDSCHGSGISGSTFYGVVPKALSNLSPAHMPTTAACETCHVGSVPTVLTPAAGVSFAGAKFSHSGIGSGCANCHGPTIVPSSFAGSPAIVVMPTSGAAGAVHIPSSVSCESCHLGSTPSTLLDGNATKLLGPGTRFQTPAPTASMIHANSDVSSCNTCHEVGRNWIGMTLYPGSPTTYSKGANYTGFQTRPTAAGGGFSVQDSGHTQGGDCVTCHTGFTGFTTPVAPAGHIPTSTAAKCSDCHTSADFTGTVSLTNIHRFAPSTSSNCAQCHSAANAPLYSLKYATVPTITAPPAEHIPMGSAGCETCHVGAGSSMATTPVVDGALFSNSKFSHTGMDKPCSFCHGVNVDATTFTGLPAIKAMTYAAGPNKHMPVSSQLGCDSCHVNSVPTGLVPDAAAKTFGGAQFTHTGITADCANCHGPGITAASFVGGGSIVVMPPSAASGPASHIPSSTACEACHMGSMPTAIMAGTASKLTGPGTRFQSPAPTSAVIHANSVVSACETCHGSGKEWIGMAMYPSSPLRTVTPVRGTVYTGFQTRPGGGGSFAVNDPSHTSTETCANCHTGYSGFGPPSMPSTHIPVSPTAVCGNCHTNPDFAVMPALSNIHKYAPSYTTNCAQCHSQANAALYPMTPALKAADGTHMPMGSLGCESCHVASVTNLSTINNPSFGGSQFSHSGVSSGCAACHVTGVGPFQGTSTIVAIPATTGAPGPTSHLPTGTTCETCHLGSTPTTLLPAVAINSVSNSAFATPAPTAAMIHTGVTGSCSTCHDTGGSGTSADVWMNMAPYPATSTAPFKGFQTRPGSTPTTAFRVQDAAHPTSGDCSSCHSSFTDFASTVKPANHIPTAAVACTNCHTTSNYAAMPTLTAIHANAPSTTGNCAQCHSAANALIYNQLAGMNNTLVAPNNTHVPMGNLGCENCHVGANSSISALPVLTGANFKNSAFSHSGITSGCASCHGDLSTPRSFVGQTQTLTPKAMPAAHVPNTGNVGCEVCHTTVPSGLIAFTGGSGAGNTFATTQYSHKGITGSCSTCHAGSPAFTGITNLVLIPATTNGLHIPSSTAIASTQCEACHLGSTPSALVGVTGAPRALGTTGFLSPLPTGAMIHNGVTAGCSTCHENPSTWLGVQLYPRSPTTKISGATYVGFQTRPVGTGAGTYSITDSNHPGAGDCSQCHGSTTSFSVSAMPVNHIPTAASATCDACHTNINLSNGNADFSQMPTLTNIHRWAPSQTANCAQCHSDANALKYANASVVGMAVIKSPATVARHVPIGTTACEVCHIVSGAVVDSSTFAGGKYSHSGITSGCASCHGNGLAANYFTGISNLVAIPTTAAMGSSAHIPYTGTCESCHAGSTPSTLLSVTGSPAAVSGFRLPAPTGAMIHGSINSGCNQCHDTNYVWKGVDLYPINPSLKTAGANYKGFQTRPVAAPATAYGITDSAHPTTGDCSQCHTGTSVFTALAKPAGHMPTTTPTCSVCHSSDYSVAGLGLPGNLSNMHTGIKTGMVTYTAATIGSKTCVTCHTAGTGGTSGTAPFAGCATAATCAAPPPLNAYQPTLKEAKGAHVPIGTLDCNGCHGAVTPNFVLTNMMKNQTMHDNAKLAGVLCKDCHENGMSWYGVTGLKVRVPSIHTTTARKAPNNCDNAGCHANSTVTNGFRMLLQPMMREALVSPDMARIRPTMQPGRPSRGTLGNSYDHAGVQAGQCKTCHDGRAASGMPARHLMVSSSCDTCHRATTWTPAQFNHSGVTPNTCMACHNGMSASAKPGGHFMTARSCDSCHRNTGWKPVSYQHLSPQYHPSPDMLTCVSCHVTNGEIIPRQMRGLNRTKPIPIGP